MGASVNAMHVKLMRNKHRLLFAVVNFFKMAFFIFDNFYHFFPDEKNAGIFQGSTIRFEYQFHFQAERKVWMPIFLLSSCLKKQTSYFFLLSECCWDFISFILYLVAASRPNFEQEFFFEKKMRF
jgi:hypothetical protein